MYDSVIQMKTINYTLLKLILKLYIYNILLIMETLKPYQTKIINNVCKALSIQPTNDNIIKNINSIYSYIDVGANYKTTTKRDYLIILSLIMKALNRQELGEVIYDRAKQHAKEYMSSEYKQELDENEKVNYITYNELLNKLQALIDVYNNKPTFKNILKVVILGLYVLHPPIRNDYYNMRIIYNDYEDDKKNNFLLIDDRQNIYIILNQDKVINLHGRGEIPITDKLLKAILLLYLTTYAANNVYLFQNTNGTPYTKRQIQYIINGLFTNKTLNIYNLRSAYISNYYKTHHTLLERSELADKMRHGQKMAEMSYLKFL